MKYTIAIPTYNNEKTIQASVESALSQVGGFEYEVLVVNNMSTDSTLQKLQNLQKKYDFRLVDNEKHVSLFENHNVCLMEANTKYVLFCHSDDVLYDDALIKIDASLNKYNYPQKIVCWGRSLFKDFYSNYSKVARLNTIISGFFVQELFQNGGLTPSGTCYSRESFLKSGGFLHMKDRITPSDMTSMIKYSLDGGEFLMIDRILFERTFASTAANISEEQKFNSYQDAMGELLKVTDAKVMEMLFFNTRKFSICNIFYVSSLSKFSKNRKKINYIKLKILVKQFRDLKSKFIISLLLKM